MDTINIALLGYGNVGSALVELIEERTQALKTEINLELNIFGIAVRNDDSKRFAGLKDVIITTDSATLVADPKVDVVVELIGGIEPARSLILSALKSGKSVVTGNKELLAKHGAELYQAAEVNGVDILFEASTAGAIPILRLLRESLLGEDVRRIIGIVNGTTNYILSQMTEHGEDYADALAEAQHLGYAESDPTADVEGYDAAAKAAIMASLAFGKEVVADDVFCVGISKISKFDIKEAADLGYVIKLLAIAEQFPDEEIGVRVHPVLVPVAHPLATTRGSYNAVFVEGAASAELMFYGKGAGGRPTASAVLGDIIDAANNIRSGTHRIVSSGKRASVKPILDLTTSFYLALDVDDAPGVLAKLASQAASQGISISSLRQEPLSKYSGDTADSNLARIVLITHKVSEEDFHTLLDNLVSSNFVKQINSVLRVLD